MNTDDFENKLKALAGDSARHDPTGLWKGDILARARQKAGAKMPSPTLPPRWLMAVWGAAWLVIVLMQISTPATDTPGGANMAATAPKNQPAASSTAIVPGALVAFTRDLNPYLDLP